MIYLEDYSSYNNITRKGIDDNEVYNDILKYITTVKSEHGEVWGSFGKRLFMFSRQEAYIRKNTRYINGKNYDVLEIADFNVLNEQDTETYYTNFLKWCLEKSPLSIFIESGEYNVFKIFGQYITDDGRPNTFNILEELGFTPYEKDNSMFYLLKQ